MKNAVLDDPIEQRIGNFLLYMDINKDGDLQIRVYPVDEDGISWDFPIDTFETTAASVKKCSEG